MRGSPHHESTCADCRSLPERVRPCLLLLPVQFNINHRILNDCNCYMHFRVVPNDIFVRLGSYEFGTKADPTSEDTEVANFKIHPNYDRTTQKNDLAIITLKRPASIDGSLIPICLPQGTRTYEGEQATVTGWGTTSFGGAASKRLKQVTLPVWSNSECASAFPTHTIERGMLCAGEKQGGKDSCQGDSGGPLMIEGPRRRWMLIGVVSWGIKCGQPNSPGVYTRVSEYLDWIANETSTRRNRRQSRRL